MAYLAVDQDGTECIYYDEPVREQDEWYQFGDVIPLPKGSIAKLIGRELSWEDEPVELRKLKNNIP